MIQEADTRADTHGTWANVPWDVAALRERLHKAVNSVCPSWMSADREDLVQTTLISVLRRHGSSAKSPAVEGSADEGSTREGVEPPSASYLRRAAYNALVDEIRRRQRRQEVALDDGRSSSDSAQEGASSRSRETPADPGAGPEAHLDGGEIRHAVRACLQELVAPRRRAVTLYLMGDSVPRAAERLGWSRKRTENLVFRGLADLRGCLSARGMTP